VTGNRSKTVRIIEISELLDVSKQRAHQIADVDSSPFQSGRVSKPPIGSGRGHGVGEALAPREALALVADQRSGFGRRRFPGPDLADDRDCTRSRE
jgi:hypothetical protein